MQPGAITWVPLATAPTCGDENPRQPSFSTWQLFPSGAEQENEDYLRGVQGGQ